MPSVSAWLSSISFAEEWVEAVQSYCIRRWNDGEDKGSGILNAPTTVFSIAEEDFEVKIWADLFGIRAERHPGFPAETFSGRGDPEAGDTAAFIMESDKFLSKRQPTKKMMKSTHLEDGMSI